jgi:hypothetical protein
MVISLASTPFRRELQLLAFFLLPLSQPDAGTTAVLFDEFDPSGLKRPSNLLSCLLPAAQFALSGLKPGNRRFQDDRQGSYQSH